MTADVLRRAADAMDAEADRLDTLDADATGSPWALMANESLTTEVHGPLAPGTNHPRPVASDVDQHRPGDDDVYDHNCGDGDLIVHRRNTVARDAATLRATADAMRTELQMSAPTGTEPYGHFVAVARAFLGEVTP